MLSDGNFAALVAQWIEQRFPKPRVAGSIPAGGTIPKSQVKGTFRSLLTAAQSAPSGQWPRIGPAADRAPTKM